jgi:hypothetical protein
LIKRRSLTLASAAVEAGTGLALLIAPGLVGRALLGTRLARSGVATARICGLALISLGLACRPEAGARARDAGLRPSRALLAYNALAAGYLGSLRIRGGFRGIALVPAALFHAVMTGLLAKSLANEV